jgi:hypothetical protein
MEGGSHSAAAEKQHLDFAERMFQVGSDGASHETHENRVVGIEMGANTFIHSIAGCATSDHPLGIEQATRAEQLKILDQLRIFLLRFRKVKADHVQGHDL